jgi:PAS domain-containing protein
MQSAIHSIGHLGAMERYVAFAFAAAEMLVETDCHGRIIFATGAFRARLNLPPEAVLGMPVADLIALKDRGAFHTALAMLPVRGRLEPSAIALSDDNATPFVVSGLYLDMPGHPRRLCLSFAPPPAPFAPDVTPRGPAAMLRDVEGRIRRAAADRRRFPTLRLVSLRGAHGCRVAYDRLPDRDPRHSEGGKDQNGCDQKVCEVDPSDRLEDTQGA